MRVMSKKLMVVSALLCSMPSFAMSNLETKVLAKLIANSASIKLHYEYSPEFGKQLPELIADHLSYNYEQREHRGNIILSATNLICESFKGINTYKCRVRFTDAQFEKEGRSLMGPNEDSAVLFHLDVSVQENGTPVILNKVVTAYLAG